MKRRFYRVSLVFIGAAFWLAAFAVAMFLFSPNASASYYPVYGGSLEPYTGEYYAVFDNWTPATFYGTTIPVYDIGGSVAFRGLDPEYWNYVCSVSGMPFLSAMAQTWDGVMPVFTDYIVGHDWVFSFETHPVEERPAATPIPPSAVMLGTGLIGIVTFKRSKKRGQYLRFGI